MTRRPGMMEPPDRGSSRPLLEADPGAFADFDLHVEARRLLWLVSIVLAVVLAAIAAFGD